MRTRALLVAAFAFLVVLECVAPAQVANYYLKADCANNGNGTASGCAASNGAAGAWNSVDNANTGWAAVCTAGDTLWIRAKADATETIASNNNDDARWHGGLKVPCSGTSGHPVAVRAFAGEIGKLANGPVGCTSATCDNTTLSTAEHNYVEIGSADGLWSATNHLEIRGMLAARGLDVFTLSSGVKVTGVELTQGWDDDGNWSPLRLENLSAPYVAHNYIHDVSLTPDGLGNCAQYPDHCNASSGTGIKLFTAINSIIEYNSIYRVCTAANCGTRGVTPSQAGGIDDKQDSNGNTHRFNYIEDVNVCLRIENQNALLSSASGTRFYGNVCVRKNAMADGDGRGAWVLADGPISDVTLDHNTADGFPIVLFGKGTVTASGVHWHDNLSGRISGAAPLLNINDDVSTFARSAFNADTDYNVYDSDADFSVDGTVTTLSAWASALGSGKESHSSEAATPCGGFTTGSDTDYHLTGSCTTASSTGGEVGAYGVTSCVGHLCSAGGAPAPTVSSVSPNTGTTAGGTSITITGSDFVATPTVTIGGASATGCSFVNSTTLTCTTPAGSAGAANVVVTNPDAQSGTLVGGFTYTSPGSPTTYRRPFLRRR